MKCPTCEYELDRLERRRCPRCGSLLNCSVVDCGSCNACGSSVTGIGRWLFGASDDDE